MRKPKDQDKGKESEHLLQRRFYTRSALQPRKWQLVGMSYGTTAHYVAILLPALRDNLTAVQTADTSLLKSTTTGLRSNGNKYVV